MSTLYTNETIIAMSPVPPRATGPVHQPWDMHTAMSGIEVSIVQIAAYPRARLGCDGTFHASAIAYADHRRRKIKCSVSTIATKGPSQ